MGKRITFAPTTVDTSTIPYMHKEREEARLRRQQAVREEQEAADRAEAGGGSDGDGDDDDEDADSEQATMGGGGGGDNRSIKSGVSKRGSMMSSMSRPWIPPEQYVQDDTKRKRKKKQGMLMLHANGPSFMHWLNLNAPIPYSSSTTQQKKTTKIKSTDDLL